MEVEVLDQDTKGTDTAEALPEVGFQEVGAEIDLQPLPTKRRAIRVSGACARRLAPLPDPGQEVLKEVRE